MKPDDFEVGEAVVYVSNRHLEIVGGEKREDGVVTSINDTYVFVRFTLLQENGIACNPNDLEHRNV